MNSEFERAQKTSKRVIIGIFAVIFVPVLLWLVFDVVTKSIPTSFAKNYTEKNKPQVEKMLDAQDAAATEFIGAATGIDCEKLNAALRRVGAGESEKCEEEDAFELEDVKKVTEQAKKSKESLNSTDLASLFPYPISRSDEYKSAKEIDQLEKVYLETAKDYMNRLEDSMQYMRELRVQISEMEKIVERNIRLIENASSFDGAKVAVSSLYDDLEPQIRKMKSLKASKDTTTFQKGVNKLLDENLSFIEQYRSAANRSDFAELTRIDAEYENFSNSFSSRDKKLIDNFIRNSWFGKTAEKQDDRAQRITLFYGLNPLNY